MRGPRRPPGRCPAPVISELKADLKLRYHQSMHFVAALPGFRTYDSLLEPIAAKVQSGERLNSADGLALYRSKDVLAVGWLANYVRERMHGDITYFNVNRHINPTNVCVAACKLCAFGRKKGDRLDPLLDLRNMP